MFNTLLKPTRFAVMALSTVFAMSVAEASDDARNCEPFYEELNAGDVQPSTAGLSCRYAQCGDACYWAGEYLEREAEAEEDEDRAASLRREAFEILYPKGCSLNHEPSCAKLVNDSQTDAELQVAAADEAEAFRETCSGDPNYFLHYDCACLSQEYEAERLKQGSNAPESHITLAINKKCADAEEAKKEIIASCLSSSLTPEDSPKEEFCPCVGETYQRMWEESGLAGNSRNYTAIRTQAATACQ